MISIIIKTTLVSPPRMTVLFKCPVKPKMRQTIRKNKKQTINILRSIRLNVAPLILLNTSNPLYKIPAKKENKKLGSVFKNFI